MRVLFEFAKELILTDEENKKTRQKEKKLLEKPLFENRLKRFMANLESKYN